MPAQMEYWTMSISDHGDEVDDARGRSLGDKKWKLSGGKLRISASGVASLLDA